MKSSKRLCNLRQIKKIIFFPLASLLTLNVNASPCTTSKLESDVSKGSASCKEYHVNRTIYIKKKVNFNGKGARITGVGAFKQCDKYPTNKAVFWITSSGSTLRNFTIVTSPEGIHVAKGRGNTLENITFSKVCEDAITNGDKTSSSATRTIVRGCKFYNAEDKAIQSNGGTMLVEKSYFKDVNRPISTCGNAADGKYHGPKKCHVKSTIYVQDSTFVNSTSYAMQAAGEKKSILYSRRNKFQRVPRVFRTLQTGKIYSAESECQRLKSSSIICDSSKTNQGFSNF
jgi:hypothetical protein